MDYGIFHVRTDVNARDCTRGCTDTIRESALKVDCGEKKKKKEKKKKIPCRAGESHLHRHQAGPVLYQLSYIPTLSVIKKKPPPDYILPISAAVSRFQGRTATAGLIIMELKFTS